MLMQNEFVTATPQSSVAGSTRSSDGRLWVGTRTHRGSTWFRTFFPVIAACADGLSLLAMAVIIGWLYHLSIFGENPVFENLYQVGTLIALLVVVPNIARQEYQISRFLTSKGHAQRLFQLWNLAFLSATALGFLTKTSTTFSRVTIVLFYVFGFLTVVAVRALLARSVQVGSKRGLVSVRRAFLVGTAEELRSFGERYQPWNIGFEIVGVATLKGEMDATGEIIDAQISEDIERAVTTARSLDLDDVFVLVPWSKNGLINHCVDGFLNIPAALHLGPERVFDRFDDVRISKIGPIASLNLVRRPLSLSEQVEKRIFDTTLALVGLVVLAPVFLFIAMSIKLDSKGPVFFRQTRYGFNQRKFSILKFRTMSVMDDGVVVRQARKNDARVTRIGYWLRRLSLDELPQLWNVVQGHMSLVGPRPHALAHDREFERKISRYARRHNVKPGITGWAQVNGHRGETSTDDKMEARVSHDLYYIDNWSIWLDLRILALTVLSSKARSNAY